MAASNFVGAIANNLSQTGKQRQTTRQTVRKNLSKFNPTGECLKALNALGINTKDILNAFDKTKFIASSKQAIDHADTFFSFSKKTKTLNSATTTTRNGVSDFLNNGIGYLVHELSHSASLRNDSSVYKVLNGKVTGLPKPNGMLWAG